MAGAGGSGCIYAIIWRSKEEEGIEVGKKEEIKQKERVVGVKEQEQVSRVETMETEYLEKEGGGGRRG